MGKNMDEETQRNRKWKMGAQSEEPRTLQVTAGERRVWSRSQNRKQMGKTLN